MLDSESGVDWGLLPLVSSQGKDVGILAQQLYPGGVLITEDYKNPEGAIESTKVAIETEALAIFEAAVLFDDILVRVDILKRNHDGTWDLFEVKSSTSVKVEHLQDAAIQKFVLENSGLKVNGTFILHLDRTYVRKGGLDLTKLFKASRVDEKMQDSYKEVPPYLEEIRKTLSKDTEPKQWLGSHCKSPYKCEFKASCWKDVSKDSIHYLSRISDKKRLALIQAGIEKVSDIPDDFEMSGVQQVQVRSERDGKQFIDWEPIAAHLSELKYPLYFLDFETYGYAVPEFDGTRPYEALPFQFSLYIQEEPDGELKHREFLHCDRSDPRPSLAAALVEAIGPVGSVVTYHASFEKSKIEKLAENFPEYERDLLGVAERIWDLETPFSRKWYYDPKFRGSSSIKYVLPALVPKLSYSDLNIQNGEQALHKYLEMNDSGTSAELREKIRQDLLAYCKLDSLAMVEILAVLRLFCRQELPVV